MKKTLSLRDRIWFIYKINNSWKLIFDGENVKWLLYKEYALKWYLRQKDFSKYSYSVYNLEYTTQVPIYTWDEELKDITTEFFSLLGVLTWDGALEERLVMIRQDFHGRYDVLEDSEWYVVFRETNSSKTSWDIDYIMWNMKNFIMWFTRIEPIYDEKGNDVHISEHYYDWQKWTDWELLKWHQSQIYTYKWKQYKTPLFWVYVPHMVKTIFWWQDTLPSWRPLQSRQRWFIWKMGQVNFLRHSRWWWKTLLAKLIELLLAVAQSFNPKHKRQPLLINYFWQSEEANADIVEYLKTMIDINGQKYFKYQASKSTFIFRTYIEIEWRLEEKILARIRIKTAWSKAKWRWWRPYAVIIDEADRIPVEVYEAAIGNAVVDKTLIFALSTIDHKTHDWWFVDESAKGIFKQINYKPVEDVVFHIRHKYWFDKLKSPEDIDPWKMRLARDELLKARPFCSMFYTIDDIEFMTDEEKSTAVNDFKSRWDDFILAEFYSTVAKKKTIFDPSGMFVWVMPSKFDVIVLWYDMWWWVDNAALSVCWVLWWSIYVIDSILLESGIDSQIARLKAERKKWWRFTTELAHIPIIADVSWNPEWNVSWFRLRKIRIDYPITSNKWYGKNKEKGWVKIWKNRMVLEMKEMMTLWYIQINKELDNGTEKSLVSELKNFGEIKTRAGTVTYHALTWKDDQVDAMMMAVFYIYTVLRYKARFAEIEWREFLEKQEVSEEKMLQVLAAQKERERQIQASYSIINF